MVSEISGTDQVNQNHLHLYEILLVPTELCEQDADCQICSLSWLSLRNEVLCLHGGSSCVCTYYVYIYLCESSGVFKVWWHAV